MFAPHPQIDRAYMQGWCSVRFSMTLHCAPMHLLEAAACCMQHCCGMCHAYGAASAAWAGRRPFQSGPWVRWTACITVRLCSEYLLPSERQTAKAYVLSVSICKHLCYL